MKTYAYEICEPLGGAVPDVMVTRSAPAAACGAPARASSSYGGWESSTGYHGWSGCSRPSARRWSRPSTTAGTRPITVGDAGATIAQSIAGDTLIHGGRRLLRALRDSGGSAIGVSEPDIGEAMRLLGGQAIAAEPSAAVSIAALLHARERGLIGPGETVAAVITGSALKQPAALLDVAPPPMGDLRADAAQWRAALSGGERRPA